MNANRLSRAGPDLRSSILAGGLIVLAGLAAYGNSFRGAFIYDDLPSIVENPTIRHLWPIWKAFAPAATSLLGGRPVLHGTLAVNYALGGLSPWGYHLVNLVIHLLAGLTLFGSMRRTLLRPVLCSRFGSAALPLALTVALLWVVHPLQTEAVTYVSQRCESLMGLFYLLTVYCFIRGIESRRQNLWLGLAVVACWLGMASKEVMVTAPVLVLLYDRTFVAGSFQCAWKERWRWYLGLGSSWLLLAYFMVGLEHRSVGYGLGVNGWRYAWTECRVVVQYLRLAIWPYPLVFDYGAEEIIIRQAAEAAPAAWLLLGLGVGIIMALRRWPVLGFAGAWVFVILAPTSSVVPITGSPMAEHRMYLSLAAVIALVVLGGYRVLGPRSRLVFLALAVGSGVLTWQRNWNYCNAEAIWSDTVAKRPNNSRAQSCLGVVWAEQGREVEAIARFREALRLDPDYADAHNNLGNALAKRGQLPEAVGQYREALRLQPHFPRAHNNLGNALAGQERTEEAMAHFREALRLNPDYFEAHYNLGLVLAKRGQLPEAIEQYREALRLDPDYQQAHTTLGLVLADQGQTEEAMVHLRAALRLNPKDPEAHYNLGLVLADHGQLPEAMDRFREAVRLKPADPEAHNILGVALADQGRTKEAAAHFQEALRLQPDYAAARDNLKNLKNAPPVRDLPN